MTSLVARNYGVDFDPAGRFVCPDCKAPLDELYCSPCAHRYARTDGFPVLFSREQRFATAARLGEAYDDIYTARSDVWAEQGRTPEFLDFFSGLANRLSPLRYLEIGCGEGFLLSVITAPEKCAIDLSARALGAARERTRAELCLALAERLPFPSGHFDVVASVGVMEHFLDDTAVAREVNRVLRPGGRYIALVHVHLTAWDRLLRFLWPRPRPLALARSLIGKLAHRRKPTRRSLPKQPIQNRFTIASAKASIESGGLQVLEVLHTGRNPGLPLIGPYVVIYLAPKPPIFLRQG
jgi:SAM-dependent methyltransferase